MIEKKKSLFFLAAIVFLIGLFFCGQSYSQSRGKIRADKNDPDYISLGMYYFDAWTLKFWTETGTTSGTMENMKNYPDREPLLGWYDQAAPGIVEQQVNWMIDYGIDFIVFTFYYEHSRAYESRIRPNVGLFKYLESTRKNEIDFAILWGDHSTNLPEDKTAWDRIVNYWLDNFITDNGAPRPEYKRIDGKPVIFIFQPFQPGAVDIGFASSAAMLDRAKELAKDRGIEEGLYFVLCAASMATVNDITNTGVDAVTSYNMPQTPDYRANMDFYKQRWQDAVNVPAVASGQIPYFLPLLAGFDDEPWNNNINAPSIPDQFKEHLIDGRSRILENPAQTMRTAVICAWNEHGEGSVVEPTKKFRFDYLNRIWNIFRSTKKLKANEGAIIKFPVVISNNWAERPAMMIIPERTFSEDVAIDVKQQINLAPAQSHVRELQHTNIGVRIDAPGKKPEREIELRIPYAESDITGMNEDGLVISRYDEEKNVWVPLPSKVDKVNKQVTVNINHLSVYAIMGTASAVKAFEEVKYYPNPLQPSKGLNYSRMNFSNIPAGTRIKIYTMLGRVVRELKADAAGMAVWDGKNNAGEKAASGVYIVYMEDGNGNKKRIKIAVER